MSRFILIGFLILTGISTGLAQPPDIKKKIESLSKEVLTGNDTVRINALIEISNLYINAQQKDSAWLYATLAYHAARETDYAHGLARSLSRQSKIIRMFDENFPRAESLAKASLQWYDHSPYKTGIDTLYDQLWDLNYAQSHFDESIKYLQKKYQYAQKAGNPSGMWDAIMLLGYSYFESGNFEKAFHYERLVYQHALKVRDTINIQLALFAFGALYMRMEDYPTALSYFRQGFQLENQQTVNERINDGSEIWVKTFRAELFSQLHQFDSAWHYYQLLKPKESDIQYRVYLVSTGECHFLQGNYTQALQNFLQGLSHHYQLNDRNQIMRTLINIAKTYAVLNNDSAALRYAREGLHLALETQAKQNIRDACKVLYMVYDGLNKKDSAYLYFRQYITMKEAVASAQIKGKFAAFQFEQKIELLNKEKEIQHAKLQRISLIKNLVSVGAILLLIFGFVLFRIIILKRRNDKHLRELAENELQIQKLESDKTKAEFQQQRTDLEIQALRAQMNPHFIFNCLNAINHFILKNETETASDYLTKFSRLVRLVLQTSSQRTVTLYDEIEMLRYYIELEQMRFQKHFSYTIDCDPMLDTESVSIPPLLLQPFVENAIWHGLMHTDKPGNLHITLQLREEMLHCTITDNGVGRHKAAALKSKSASQNKSMGLQITASRLKMLNQEYNESYVLQIIDLKDQSGEDCGTEVKVIIPVKIKQYATT